MQRSADASDPSKVAELDREPEPELGLEAPATDAEATVAPHAAATMAARVAFVDRRVGLNRRDRTKAALSALHRRSQVLASSYLECHRRNSVDCADDDGVICLQAF